MVDVERKRKGLGKRKALTGFMSPPSENERRFLCKVNLLTLQEKAYLQRKKSEAHTFLKRSVYLVVRLIREKEHLYEPESTL